MKQLAAAAAALFLILLSCLTCSAAEKDFYLEYTKKTETGTVFYIDVSCDRKISGAVFELCYDDGMTEFRTVSAVSTTASCREKLTNGAVKIAFTDEAAVSGKICRVAFKALKTGKATFHLQMIQAADENLKLPNGFSDDSLTITLGKEDVSAADGASATKTRTSGLSSASSAASSSGSNGRSFLKESGDDIFPSGGDVLDLRKTSPWGYILFGAGLVILIAGLVFLGMILGKKNANKKAAENKENLPENTEEEKADDKDSKESEEEPAADISEPDEVTFDITEYNEE